MAYQVIARKWRPKKFSEVVGQEHVIKTLRNELIQGRMAHAYLFVGPRGIGKTTIARIFAKALNCKKPLEGEPCCECDSCIGIANGSSLDVIEIDGASNNSVENIRSLRDEVHYAPVNSKYKIYIIDEVHMLSTAAWNALLKTVEEPPSHVKFLFATTEAHKVLGTIVSRCQRFDLRHISVRLISENLKKIAVSENVRISARALEAIARAAEGGMRDAQSLLDQVISFFSGTSEEISETEVLEIFGLTAVEDMETLTSAILENDKASLVSTMHRISSQGKNLEKLFDDILDFIRSIEICLILPEPEKILEESEEAIALFKKMAKGTDISKIQLILENLSQSSRSLHDALNKQVFLETIILKAMRIAHSVKIQDLIERIQQMRDGESPGEGLKKNSEGYSARSETISVEIKKMQTASSQVQDLASDEEKTPVKNPIPEKLKKYSPESLWHELINYMDKINRPLLKGYMQEGKPMELTADRLTVVYDLDFELLHVNSLRSEVKILNQCLHSITGNKNLAIEFKTEKIVSSPSPSNPEFSNISEVRDRISKNKFVSSVLELFEGRIIEIRG